MFLWCFSIGIACKNDDNSPVNPVDALPPATQIGAQTFGCLVDGKVFLPKSFGHNRLNAFYQNSNDSFTLSISSESSENNTNRYFIIIGGAKVQNLEEKSYELGDDIDGKYTALFTRGSINDQTLSTTDMNPGKLNITFFDPTNFIVSGTFEFTVLDNDGKEIKITDGRFDLNYTN